MSMSKLGCDGSGLWRATVVQTSKFPKGQPHFSILSSWVLKVVSPQRDMWSSTSTEVPGLICLWRKALIFNSFHPCWSLPAGHLSYTSLMKYHWISVLCRLGSHFSLLCVFSLVVLCLFVQILLLTLIIKL